MLRSIDIIFQVYLIMLFVRIFGSWFPEFQRTRFMLFIAFYTDPYLNIFRRIIPPIGILDISPIFAFFFLNILQSAVQYIILSVLR